MEQKLFYSGINVQRTSNSFTTIPVISALPAIPLFLYGWNRPNRWNTLPAQPIPKNCHISFSFPLFHLFLFFKIVKRNAVLAASFIFSDMFYGHCGKNSVEDDARHCFSRMWQQSKLESKASKHW